MKYATMRYNGLTVAGAVDPSAEIFWPFRDGHRDVAAALPALANGPLPLGTAIAIKNVEMLAPILSPPRNIMCVGKNYRAHAEEFSKSGFDAGSSAKDAIPEFPIIFSKPSSTIGGPSSNIPLTPGLDAGVDYEAELAVIIGKGGRGITQSEAMSHVFGYTIVNDVTARDLQQRHKQWFLGKGADGFCPMGPWIVTADEIDYRDMRVICRVNGDVRQNASTRDLIFDIPFLIETISKGMTLVPGDIIATGTPEGVGIGFSPPKFLVDGDIVECEITGIGMIRNAVCRV